MTNFDIICGTYNRGLTGSSGVTGQLDSAEAEEMRARKRRRCNLDQIPSVAVGFLEHGECRAENFHWPAGGNLLCARKGRTPLVRKALGQTYPVRPHLGSLIYGCIGTF